MKNMNLKSQVIDVVQALPDNANIDDIKYELMVIESINRGRKEIANGKGISHKSACNILGKKWNIK
jgi:hypothetical protein